MYAQCGVVRDHLLLDKREVLPFRGIQHRPGLCCGKKQEARIVSGRFLAGRMWSAFLACASTLSLERPFIGGLCASARRTHLSR